MRQNDNTKKKSIQEEKIKVGPKINVGIDVGKAQLDLFLHEIKRYFSVENNPFLWPEVLV